MECSWAPVLAGEVHAGEHVLGDVFEQISGRSELGAQHLGEVFEVGQRGGVVGLGEDRPHDGDDRLLSRVRHRRQ